ncbi:predicted protein [Lichtheimia corymbifera JMRC:FSU:9682]|uniref:Uncharacterized protein n=1 Tax=Lichtheimia corymbifera JMRC:FSU:9682 TaxID=1263082 RepID=A0A068S9M4_9FUNG|nr:predicted protein [Lichtheimia corymbifera JMRC:FSU:9682]
MCHCLRRRDGWFTNKNSISIPDCSLRSKVVRYILPQLEMGILTDYGTSTLFTLSSIMHRPSYIWMPHSKIPQ